MVSLSAFDSIDNTTLQALESGLRQTALENGHIPYKATPLSVLAYDNDRVLIGGLTGKTVWDWLYIRLLWVAKQQRGCGLGSSLIKRAETLALERCCHSAYLWTESFEAPEFYQKLGYQQFAVKKDFPLGHRRIGFMKRLAA